MFDHVAIALRAGFAAMASSLQIKQLAKL